MLHFSNFKRAMESDTISKNGWSTKSQMSSGNFIKVCFSLLVMGLFFSSCTKEEDKLPTITTTSASNIGVSIATLGGSIIDENASDYSDRGVVYATSENPTIGNSKKTVSGKGEVGSFKTTVTGLSANTTYYVRAYAIYTNGTTYGDQINFKTVSSYAGQKILGRWSNYNSLGDFTTYYTFDANGTGTFVRVGGSGSQATFGWAINGQIVSIGLISGSFLVGLVLDSEMRYDSTTDQLDGSLSSFKRVN